ncbi:hypothetical protein CRG98_023371 [Punica granatum]|uniref:Integrase catalytic domain-containing protein n=1 Tax=Punica granatum TaxID=22663 RepID=A0A2I0JJX6_PUNGR|nr:hypothetical protein CRG98_023371 [Punica granatum]
MWGMDVIGPINPKASNGHMFILVATDYFTKWIEAVTLALVTAKAVARFLRRDVIARYGVPVTIITDNAKNLNNKVYPVTLDPGNLPALDFQVVKWQVATPSHVRPSRVLVKVDTPKPRLLRRAHACPDEIKFGYAQYLTVRRQSMGCMLGQKDDSSHAERAIYYLWKKFTEGESNYPEIEKMCCTLVWVMQRLRQYTLYHIVRLLSKIDPVRTRISSRRGTHARSLRSAAWECPPSRGCATDTREKESPFTVYDP